MNANLPTPCLHRVHSGNPEGSFRMHHSLGVSVERTDLVRRLNRLNLNARRREMPDRSVLVTFDDGWVDPVALAPHFRSWSRLQPTLFLTMRQTSGDQSLLPLPRLYEWCSATGTSLAKVEEAGMTRKQLKLLPEKEQHEWLDRLEVPRISASPEILAAAEIVNLMNEGWIVGSHGHDHHDLRLDDPVDLQMCLRKARDAVTTIGGKPWLAWPEGRCTASTCEAARLAGFEKQFSLRVESESIQRSDLVHRDIWS